LAEKKREVFNKSRFHVRNNFIFYSNPASLFLLLIFYKIFDLFFVFVLLLFDASTRHAGEILV